MLYECYTYELLRSNVALLLLLLEADIKLYRDAASNEQRGDRKCVFHHIHFLIVSRFSEQRAKGQIECVFHHRHFFTVILTC